MLCFCQKARIEMEWSHLRLHSSHDKRHGIWRSKVTTKQKREQILVHNLKLNVEKFSKMKEHAGSSTSLKVEIIEETSASSTCFSHQVKVFILN